MNLPDRDTLRALVREALADALPELANSKATGGGPAHGNPAPLGNLVEEVSVSTDGELAAFVRRVLALTAEPASRRALENGSHYFRLSNGANGTVDGADKNAVNGSGHGKAQGAMERIEKGVVTERKIEESGKAGRHLVLGRGAVVTPLARDRARQLGIRIVRES
jgi:hypothetical protein